MASDLGFQFTAVPGRLAWCEAVAPTVAPKVAGVIPNLIADRQAVDLDGSGM